MKNRLARFFIIVAANLGLILSIFLVTEAVFRIFDLPFRGSHHPFICRDSHIRKYIPNEPYEYKGEGYSRGRFNSHGFRDYERGIKKPDNTFRVAVIGDSMTEGIGVPLEKTFCGLIEEELNKRLGKKIEVMNFGVAGYSTGDEYILLKEEIMAYSPDMVVLVFFPSNDVEGNYSRLEQIKRRFYFDIDWNGSLILDDSYYKAYLNSPEGKLRLLVDGRSKVLRGLFTLYRDMVVCKKWGISHGSQIDYPNTESDLFNHELSGDYETAWKITEKLLSEIKEYAESKNAKFLLVSVPSGIQLLEPKGWFSAGLPNGSIQDRPEQILRQITDRKKIDLLDLLPVFLTKSKESGNIPYFKTTGQYGHLDETGHKWVSEALSRHISRSQD